MRSMLVIGLGRFGGHLARKLSDLGNEVMVVDTDEEAVEKLAPHVTWAQVGDCMDVDTLRSLGVSNFDICFVCISNNFQSSLEITSLLKDLGAKRVISKASQDIHARLLLRNGADEVVYPERDSAERIAARLSATNVFDCIELTEEYSIYEIPPLESWVGRSVRDIDVRNRHHINILAVKTGEELRPMPGADYVFTGREHLLALASNDDARRLLKKM